MVWAVDLILVVAEPDNLRLCRASFLSLLGGNTLAFSFAYFALAVDILVRVMPFDLLPNLSQTLAGEQSHVDSVLEN